MIGCGNSIRTKAKNGEVIKEKITHEYRKNSLLKVDGAQILIINAEGSLVEYRVIEGFKFDSPTRP